MMLEFNKSNFATLADAQNYTYAMDTLKITSGKARSFFVRTPTDAQDATGKPLGDKWSELRFIQTLIIHELYSIADGIIGVIESDSYFGVDETTEVGQGNHQLIDVLVLKNFFTQAQADAFKVLRYSNTYPYKDKTQADWDALDAPEPVEQEVVYGGETYVIRTSNQGLELDIVINDGSVDNVFDVRLEVCEVDQGQHDLNNWFEITNAFTPIRQGKGSRFKWVIEASSKRIKTYNKLYLMPRKAVDFTATVKAV